MSTQTMYNAYRAAGMTHAGALAMLGNFHCESGNIPYRVQGDFTAGLSMSLSYTRSVDGGSISRQQFVYNGPNGGGYGLAQWTLQSRKAELYDKAKRLGVSIGNEDMQVQFSLEELKRDFPALWSSLCKTDDLHSAVSNVCYMYENPAIKNVEARYSAALAIEKTLDAYRPEPKPEVYWPPRMIDRNMSGPDVEVWQTILKARGYGINYISGKFDELLEAETKRFQAENGLTADGVVGPMTWRRGLAYGD